MVFFFQAEDGIRYSSVTGVQTCALPISDQFIVALFAWALLGFGNIYCGLARRALDVAIANVKNKTSMALTRSMAYHPEVQRSEERRVGKERRSRWSPYH